MSDHDNFGNYLRVVQERDVDLLLMEEFHVSQDFVAWFGRQVGLADARFSGAWHSVSDHDGETDLLLSLKVGDERVQVLIENKVAATAQPEQDARYHLRGARLKETGLCERYITCICAPATYLDSVPADTRYETRVSYESIRDWYKLKTDPREQWRGRIMDEAIAQGRRGYTMIVNSIKSQFHLDYWEYLQNHHSEILMRKPGKKGGKSDWMLMRTSEMPKGVQIVHKNDQGCVDLEFARTNVTTLKSARDSWPEQFRILPRGKSAALSLRVPTLDVEKGVEAQKLLMEEAVAAIRRLLPFCKVLS